MALSDNFVFTDMDDVEVSSLIEAMVYCKVAKGVDVILQGSSFFVSIEPF